MSQLERLTKSVTGRNILKNLELRYKSQTGKKTDVPKNVREALDIPPLSRPMHPEHDAERRAARTRALRKQLKNAEDVIYVDAARFAEGRDTMVAAMVDKQGKVVVSCSVRTLEPEVGRKWP